MGALRALPYESLCHVTASWQGASQHGSAVSPAASDPGARRTESAGMDTDHPDRELGPGGA